ncbi:hypothetical protein YA0010_18660 [Pseudomonas syringae]|uniref:hypothetical protein n=1 Tax=Pseudomonas syringae TaxID=317 RepID=UPI0018E6474A|nr:hypothetical protein [Pseudomonas syringae]MBI6849079.1 hypothetical protein [Pseudomonas syringae]
MKLVEILATKIKVWPKDATHAVQDHKGHHSGRIFLLVGPKENTTRNDSLGGWYLGRGVWTAIDPLTNCELADDCRDAIVTRDQWQAAVDSLKSPAWNGEGLPPVGMVCERNKIGTWIETTICGHSPDGKSYVAFFDDYQVGWIAANFIRPIRTAEQIAEDQRKQEIQELMIVLGSVESADYKDIAIAIQQANFRKQVSQ